jgi:hypothetical protein
MQDVHEQAKRGFIEIIEFDQLLMLLHMVLSRPLPSAVGTRKAVGKKRCQTRALSLEPCFEACSAATALEQRAGGEKPGKLPHRAPATQRTTNTPCAMATASLR